MNLESVIFQEDEYCKCLGVPKCLKAWQTVCIYLGARLSEEDCNMKNGRICNYTRRELLGGTLCFRELEKAGDDLVVSCLPKHRGWGG